MRFLSHWGSVTKSALDKTIHQYDSLKKGVTRVSAICGVVGICLWVAEGKLNVMSLWPWLIVSIIFLILFVFNLGKSSYEVSIKKEWKKSLIINPLPPQRTISNQFECVIEIENPSEDEDAKNIKVELLSIEPIPKHQASKIELPLRFPILLQPKSNISSVINPKDTARFVVFNVKQTLTDVEFEVVGVEHNVKTFTHNYWEVLSFPKGKQPDVIEYHLKITASASCRLPAKEILKLECSAKWEAEKPFILTKI